MRTIKLPFVVLMLGLWAAQAASADPIHTVTSTADDGLGTLRAALADAADGDTINFNLATTPATIQLTSGALVVDKSVTITGPGQDQLTVLGVEGYLRDRVFLVIPPDPDWTLEKTVTISGLTIANGRSVQGGGIYQLRGTLTLRDCTLKNNFAGDAGGGVFVANGTLVITRCTLSDNTVGAPDENLYTGGAVAFLVVGEDGRDNFTTLAIENSLLTRNTVFYGSGGAISILVEGGSPDHPGHAGATVTVTDSTLSGNEVKDGTQVYGGGIAIIATGSENDVESWAHLTVENSTLSGNSAIGSSYSFGGGIVMFGQSTLSVIVKLLNSTLSGNWASTVWSYASSAGGAIHAAGNGFLMVGNSTLSGNWVVGDASLAGGIFNQASEIFIWNTILNAGPSGANLYQYEDESDPSYVHINSLGYNLSSDDGGGFLDDPTDQVVTDPLLGPLADNGGPTFTHALQADSLAIDMGSAFDIVDMQGNRSDVATDQRGVARPQGSGDDIGAFELEVTGPVLAALVQQPINADGSSTFSAKRGVVPVKFTLTADGAPTCDLPTAAIVLSRVGGTMPGPIDESVYSMAADSGSNFRISDCQYVYNLAAKALATGTYRVEIVIDDAAVGSAVFELK